MYPYLKVLFVCKNDAITSLIAMNYYSGFAHSTSSVTAKVSNESIPCLDEVVAGISQLMKEDRIDFHVSEIDLVSKEMAKDADRVVIFCKKEDCPHFLLEHKSIYFWEIDSLDTSEVSELQEIIDKIKLKVFDLFRIRW